MQLIANIGPKNYVQLNRIKIILSGKYIFLTGRSLLLLNCNILNSKPQSPDLNGTLFDHYPVL